MTGPCQNRQPVTRATRVRVTVRRDAYIIERGQKYTDARMRMILEDVNRARADQVRERQASTRVERGRVIAGHACAIGTGITVLTVFRTADPAAMWLAALPEVCAVMIELVRVRIPARLRKRADARKLGQYETGSVRITRRSVKR